MAAQSVARLVICEDSVSYAEGLAWFLEHDPDLRVVGRCRTGEETLATVPRLEPDLVVMDLELPGADGIETVRRLTARHPVRILLLSAHVGRGSRLALEALEAGALDARSKNDVSVTDPSSASAVAFRRYIKRLASSRIPGASDLRPAPAAPRRRATVIGIAASTGGPPALQTVLARLPADFPVPVLVVQHIADGFLEGMIRWLDERVAIPVALGQDGRPGRPGVWFAPEGAHLIVDSDLRLRLDRASVAGYHRPSADVLFTSLASSRGAAAGAVGVVLTGMGTDGAEGVSALRAAGALTIAQDESTSTIYGMPRAAREQGAELILPLDRIGSALARLSVS